MTQFGSRILWKIPREQSICISTSEGDRIRSVGTISQKASSGQDGGISIGEGRNLEKELERKAIRRVAEIIEKFVADAGYPRWRLIAPGTILHSLVGDLTESIRSKISNTDSADITKLPVRELEKRLLA